MGCQQWEQAPTPLQYTYNKFGVEDGDSVNCNGTQAVRMSG
jgi:hypothetical protein